VIEAEQCGMWWSLPVSSLIPRATLDLGRCRGESKIRSIIRGDEGPSREADKKDHTAPSLALVVRHCKHAPAFINQSAWRSVPIYRIVQGGASIGTGPALVSSGPSIDRGRTKSG
jgi:hypothetical protein